MTNRELDAWIAENVLGLRRVEFLRDLEAGAFFVKSGGEVYLPGRQNHIDPWRPTESKSDALTVLEKCAEKIDDRIVLWNDGKYFCLSQAGSGEITAAETPPLCICKFSFALFGGKE